MIFVSGLLLIWEKGREERERVISFFGGDKAWTSFWEIKEKLLGLGISVKA